MSVISFLSSMFFSNVNSRLHYRNILSHFERLAQTTTSFVLNQINILCIDSNI